MKRNWLVEIIAFLTILLFVYTGLSKLIDHDVFVAHLKESPWPLVAHTAIIISWVLPIGELLLAVMLLVPSTQRLGFIVSAALVLIFIAYLSIILTSGKKLPCSCGGVIGYLTWKQHVVFNIFYLAICIIGILKTNRSRKDRQVFSAYKTS